MAFSPLLSSPSGVWGDLPTEPPRQASPQPQPPLRPAPSSAGSRGCRRPRPSGSRRAHQDHAHRFPPLPQTAPRPHPSGGPATSSLTTPLLDYAFHTTPLGISRRSLYGHALQEFALLNPAPPRSRLPIPHPSGIFAAPSLTTPLPDLLPRPRPSCSRRGPTAPPATPLRAGSAASPQPRQPPHDPGRPRPARPGLSLPGQDACSLCLQLLRPPSLGPRPECVSAWRPASSSRGRKVPPILPKAGLLAAPGKQSWASRGDGRKPTLREPRRRSHVVPRSRVPPRVPLAAPQPSSGLDLSCGDTPGSPCTPASPTCPAAILRLRPCRYLGLSLCWELRERMTRRPPAPQGPQVPGQAEARRSGTLRREGAGLSVWPGSHPRWPGGCARFTGVRTGDTPRGFRIRS